MIIDHSNEKKSWSTKDDLFLLQNYKKEAKELGAHLKRGNSVINGRKRYLKFNADRIKEIRREFPLEEFSTPELKRVYFRRVNNIITNPIKNQKIMQKNGSQWNITEELYLLKNWKNENNALSEHLQRSEEAIKVRKSYLRTHPKRVAEIQQTFPEAVFEVPSSKLAKYSNNVNLSSFTTTKKPRGGKMRSYDIEDEMFIVANMHKGDKWLASKIKRTPAAISVKKSAIKKELLQPNSRISKAWTTYTAMKQESKIVVRERKENTLSLEEKTFAISWSSFSLDIENKRIIFKLD